MLDVAAITQEIDTYCNREIERANAEKMRWVCRACLAFLSFGFGCVGLYAAYSKRRLYPLVVAAVAYPLAYKFFCDGYRALGEAEKIKREALKGVEEKFRNYLDQKKTTKHVKPKQEETKRLKDLIKKNAGTISSGVLMVAEMATGVPINMILKGTASFCVQQMANQPPKLEKTIDPVVETVFEEEFKRLILRAAIRCYERYMDDATVLQRSTTRVESPNLTAAITAELERYLADELARRFKHLIQEEEIEPFKKIHIPEIIRGIKDGLEDLDLGWVQV